jgi:hypothetical protein
MTLTTQSLLKGLSCWQIRCWKFMHITIACRTKKQRKHTNLLYFMEVLYASCPKEQSHSTLLNTIIQSIKYSTGHPIIFDIPTSIQLCILAAKKHLVSPRKLSLNSFPNLNL